MDIGMALIADGETAVAAEPSQRALHDPAIAAKASVGFDASADDRWMMRRLWQAVRQWAES